MLDGVLGRPKVAVAEKRLELVAVVVAAPLASAAAYAV